MAAIRGRWLAAAACAFVAVASSATAQTSLAPDQNLPPPPAANGAPPPAQTYQPPPAPPQGEKPGLFEAIGRFFNKGLDEHLRGAKRQIDNFGDEAASNSRQFQDQAAQVGKGAAEVGKGAADATKSAVDAVVRLPTSRVMKGRERCEPAPNGAPDCVAAAELLCRKHGFATGKSIDFTSAEECPVKTYLGQGGECTTITFINQAMCQ